MTRDVILTLSLLLVAGLFARLLATLLRVPEIVFLLGLGAAARARRRWTCIDVPLDSLGAQLVFTLGVSTILFYGGLNLSLEILRKVWLSLGLLAVLGVIVTAVITGAAAALVFGLPFEQGLLIGAVLSPTDPAILIPLFIGSRLRPKVAQTVVAESAFNDPTGAVLALAVAGALVSGKNSLTGPAGDFVGQLGAEHAPAACSPASCSRPPSRAAARGSGASPRRSRCSRSSPCPTSRSTSPAAAATWAPSSPG